MVNAINLKKFAVNISSPLYYKILLLSILSTIQNVYGLIYIFVQTNGNFQIEKSIFMAKLAPNQKGKFDVKCKIPLVSGKFRAKVFFYYYEGKDSFGKAVNFNLVVTYEILDESKNLEGARK